MDFLILCLGSVFYRVHVFCLCWAPVSTYNFQQKLKQLNICFDYTKTGYWVFTSRVWVTVTFSLVAVAFCLCYWLSLITLSFVLATVFVKHLLYTYATQFNITRCLEIVAASWLCSPMELACQSASQLVSRTVVGCLCFSAYWFGCYLFAWLMH